MRHDPEHETDDPRDPGTRGAQVLGESRTSKRHKAARGGKKKKRLSRASAQRSTKKRASARRPSKKSADRGAKAPLPTSLFPQPSLDSGEEDTLEESTRPTAEPPPPTAFLLDPPSPRGDADDLFEYVV